MQRIPITLAEPGMILDKAIMPPGKPDGIPLFGKGNSLTSQHIERLKNMGIYIITVTGHPLIIPGQETLEEALAGLDYRFGAVTEDPYMMRILAIFKNKLTQNFSEEP